jgi:hypothetical protein
LFLSGIYKLQIVKVQPLPAAARIPRDAETAARTKGMQVKKRSAHGNALLPTRFEQR